MAAAERSSRCSSGASNSFYWNGLPALHDQDAIAWLAGEVLRILKLKPDRRWTPYNEPLIKSEVSAMIEAGKLGTLMPVKQVKPMDRAPKEYIFEIVIDLQVSQQDATGRLKFAKAKTRVYHTEPTSVPDSFIGLHVHEKIIAANNSETNRLQNVEIDVAAEAFHRGEPHNWGV